MALIRINLIGKDRPEREFRPHTGPSWSHVFHQAVLFALAAGGSALAIFGIWFLTESGELGPGLSALLLGSSMALLFARGLLRLRNMMRIQDELLLKGRTLEVVVVGKAFRLLWLRPAWLVSVEGVIQGTRIRFESGFCGGSIAKKLRAGDRALIRYLAHNPKIFIVLSPLPG